MALLNSIKTIISLAGNQYWIIGRDFNMITSLEEKKGGNRKLDEESKYFIDLIDDLSLVDIETTNGNHTWTNKRG